MNDCCQTTHTHTHTYMLHTHSEMVDLGVSDKMIKINGKMDKSDTYKEFSNDKE